MSVEHCTDMHRITLCCPVRSVYTGLASLCATHHDRSTAAGRANPPSCQVPAHSVTDSREIKARSVWKTCCVGNVQQPELARPSLGCVTLGAQRPIVVKLSRGRSVRPSVCPVHCGKTADRIRMPLGIIGRTGPGIRQGFGIGPREGVFLGANLGCAIVINCNFTAYVCDNAATRPSSQITLGRLVTTSV